MQKYSKKWFIDTAERVLKTFVQGFVMAWLVFQDKTWDAFVSLDNLKAGLVAGAISLAMALVGGQIGSPRTAAWLPQEQDTEKGQVGIDAVAMLLIGFILGFVLAKVT